MQTYYSIIVYRMGMFSNCHLICTFILRDYIVLGMVHEDTYNWSKCSEQVVVDSWPYMVHLCHSLPQSSKNIIEVRKGDGRGLNIRARDWEECYKMPSSEYDLAVTPELIEAIVTYQDLNKIELLTLLMGRRAYEFLSWLRNYCQLMASGRKGGFFSELLPLLTCSCFSK